MRFRMIVATVLLTTSGLAAAQNLFCNRRQGWTIDGEFCARCNIVLGGQVAKKQSFGVCLNCSTGCPYEKSEIPENDAESPVAAVADTINACGMLTASPKIAGSTEAMPIALRVEKAAIDETMQRFPIAATFLALMASTPESPSVFDASSVTMGLRHQPRVGTAVAFLERGEEAMQAPFVSELALFEQVTVEVRGERSPSGGIAWWLLSSLETRKGSRVLEGPVRIELADSGSRANASVGNMGIEAPVMTVASVE